MTLDDEFLSVFNEYYPFERYIFTTPRNIGMTFDDISITEIFVPLSNTKINPNEVYTKVVGNAGEMRIGYYDFNEYIRQEIVNAFISDFGESEYEGLYVEHENNETLIGALNLQKELIMEKYGVCNIKKSVRDNLVTNEIK